MATWRKVIVSGSDAELNALDIGGGSGGSGVTLSTAGAVTADAAITAGTSFVIGSADINETDLEKLDGITDGTAAANKAVILDVSKNISTIGTIGSGAITSTGASTFGSISNASTIAASKISGSFTGSFTGDGSNLTGVAQDIDTLTELDATPHATEDEYLISDNGTEKRVSMTNVANGGFALVSGDILIAAGGAATIQANSVALSTDTTGNYVGTLTGGTGITSTGAVTGEGIAHSISVDASQTQITSVGTIGTGTWEATDVEVSHGGTGASTFTDGGVLLGSGTGAITAMSVLADGEFIVGDGTTDPVAESGATLRTSIGVGTGDSPQFTDLTLSGDLTVNGDLTYLNTANLLVEDQFIYAASGSSDVDGGLIVGGTTAGTGSALYWDKDSDRWAVSESVAQGATTVTPNQFMVTTTVHATDDPGTGDGDYGVGEMWIAEDTDDIWIRTG